MFLFWNTIIKEVKICQEKVEDLIQLIEELPDLKEIIRDIFFKREYDFFS